MPHSLQTYQCDVVKTGDVFIESVNWAIIGLGNGLASNHCHVITWTNIELFAVKY